MKRKLWVGVIVMAVLVTAAGVTCSQSFPSGTWRYRMTVTVETPEGIKTGSAVREVAVRRGIALTPESLPSVQSKGEAVAVDLGKRGVLFALTSYDDYHTVFSAFGWTSGGTTPEGIKYFSNLKDARVVLSPENYPVFVTFRDMKDPKTVEMVWQGEFYDERVGQGARRAFRIATNRFEELFGKGVKLKEITIEMTDDPVTQTVDEFLPSFREETGFLEWVNKLPYGDPRRIGLANFK